MKKIELAKEKKYTDLNIHERIDVKAWWDCENGALPVSMGGGYFYNGYFIIGANMMQTINSSLVVNKKRT